MNLQPRSRQPRGEGNGSTSLELGETLGKVRLADQAFERLREAVLEKRLEPGSRLSAPDVARRLGISRSPAREAIARLAEVGLAQSLPGKGAIVSRINEDDLREVYYLREVLEGLASRLAAERASTRDLRDLAQLHSRHRAAVNAGDVAGHFRLDPEFHRLIRASTGNTGLIEALDRLQGQIRLALDTTSAAPGRMELALADHDRIYECIAARQPQAAENAARRHIERLRRLLGPTN